MGDACVLWEGDKAGGGYHTPPHISTHGDTLAMLDLHIRAHNLRAPRDERPWTAGTRAQKAEDPKHEMNLTAHEWERWKSNWVRYKWYARLKDQGNCVFNLWACFSRDLKVAVPTKVSMKRPSLKMRSSSG